MRRILLVFFFTLSVSGCAENMLQHSDASNNSKSIAPDSKDLLGLRGPESNATKQGFFHGFNNNRVAEFVEKAEQRKSEMMQTSSGEGITMKYKKSYISAGNHLCRLFSFSKSSKTEEQQVFDNVFCRIDDHWKLLVPLSYREGQRELYNALKDTFPWREAS